MASAHSWLCRLRLRWHFHRYHRHQRHVAVKLRVIHRVFPHLGRYFYVQDARKPSCHGQPFALACFHRLSGITRSNAAPAHPQNGHLEWQNKGGKAQMCRKLKKIITFSWWNKRKAVPLHSLKRNSTAG